MNVFNEKVAALRREGALFAPGEEVFIARGQRKTFAELSPPDKNLISHRGKAFRALVRWLGRRAK